MTNWIKHDGGPQPVADDVWVEMWWPRESVTRFAASEIPWQGYKSRYRILNQHLIDAARLEGIELGLDAADKAIGALHAYDDLSREIALEDAGIAISLLDPEIIARDAADKETAR